MVQTGVNAEKMGIYSPVNSKNDPALYCTVSMFCYSLRVYDVIEESEKFKMESKTAAMS